MTEDEYHEVWMEGYRTGVAFHIDGERQGIDNPYEWETEEWFAWDDGFTQAGDDS